MPPQLDYEPHRPRGPLDARRVVRWTGIALSSLGGVIAVVVLLINAQYVNSYPPADIALFVLGVCAAPVLGLGLLAGLATDRRWGVRLNVTILTMVAILCCGVAVGGVIEAFQSFARGARIDATITAFGCALVLAVAVASVWLASKLVSRPHD